MSKHQPHVPSVGSDPREQPGEVTEPADKIWFRDLDEAVIEADRCIQCGSCVAACPSDSIGIDEAEGRPTLVRMCTGCSSCWDYCPRSGLRYERVVADTPQTGREHYAARAAGPADSVGQDGGAVTELLATLVESGEIDGAVVAIRASTDPETVEGLTTVESSDEPLYGTAALATTRDALRASAGSIYNQVMSLGRIDQLIEKAGLTDPDLALVGTPCIIQGARALGRYDHESADPIALSVALMCTRNFEHDRLAGLLVEHGVDLAAVDHLDVSDGTLFAYDEAGAVLLAESVDAFDAAGLRGCDECADFVGNGADISAGNVGSPEDTTTLVVRTDRGKQAFEQARAALDVEPLDETAAVDSLAEWNERRARDNLVRRYDPEGSVGISKTEHHDAYRDTDREPEPFNPARVHQYEEWC